ncbi:MAG: hypothetical protein MR531_04605 [Lachnospiraceae bacterium]|nr:hypothetical protein [Lachnospiraceae bacterium]
MLIEDKFYKGYKEIQKGIENYGYSEWKKEVKKEFENNNNIENIKKRVEIKIDQCEIPKKFYSLFDCVAQWVLIATVIMTLLWYYTSSLSNTISTICKDVLNVNDILQLTNDLSEYSISTCVYSLCIFILLVSFVAFIDNSKENRRVLKLIYYKEIKKIIEEIELK